MLEAVQSQNEVAILCGCAECGRRVTENYPVPNGTVWVPREGVVLIERDPDSEHPLVFPLCGECVERLVGHE